MKVKKRPVQGEARDTMYLTSTLYYTKHGTDMKEG
jgi:hypothetical protein